MATDKFKALDELLSVGSYDDDVYTAPDITLPDGYELKLTCIACPEQYDLVAPDGRLVGYFRLRYGHYRVQTPSVGGETVYVKNYDDGWRGIFPDEDRQEQLQAGVDAVLAKLGVA